MFKNKRLLILGGGRGQVGLIKTAKDMGVYVIVGTKPGDNLPGLRFADEVSYMDISDPDNVLLKAKELNLDGIATSCLDTGVTALGRVCDRLNLSGLSERAALRCQDKLKMKKALVDSGVNTAKYYKISSEEQLQESIGKLNFPVIIKATDLQGSKGIYIAYNEIEALDGFQKSITETQKDFCIVEEFIDGWEFGVQSFIANGEILFVMPHGDDTYVSHTAIPVGHHIPLECTKDIMDQAENCVREAIKALELDDCAVNVDLIVKDGKVYIIELTGRVGANCLPELVSINFGINYYEMIIAIALGIDPRNIFNDNEIKSNAGLAKMLFSEKESGVLKSIEYNGYIDEEIVDISFFKRPGDKINAFENSNDCIGQVIVKGKTLDDCKQKVERVVKEINIEIYR
ncbi:hypothetical protein J32TS6_15040 [Virgibacillus pantothenticus]|uniref:ATP-grasp domain-containing protein n=1 Tax=Virgibacillus TaxID=84406 RepID=UPI00090C46B9|nr:MULTISPECIES: ATP-grasp domain-containing protein [Virgibacillus]API92970.1 phosphoribosylglycinamide synthetase [Virgibacillus sp. 6R]MBS7428496.1 ATP-grasp domain-containing protein [Virgibacillus sp. 19R1-5]GIP62949.1 hypothetical protein J32TS6_15040 [Virgibacillus pantothenticus]